MFRLRTFAIAACVLAVCGFAIQAQDDDAKALIRKAIKAHGGEKLLTKYKAGTSKYKGTIEIAGFKADITGETSLQKPNKVKNVMTLDIKGKMIEVVTVFNGDKLWVRSMDRTQEITDEKILKAAREEMQAEAAGGLVDYLKEPYAVSSLGVVKVKGKDAVGIRVSKKDAKDFSLFFDKASGLIVKTEMRTLDAMSGQEVTQEKYIMGYKDKEGMKVPDRVEIYKDGKVFMEIEMISVQALEKLDDSVFAKP